MNFNRIFKYLKKRIKKTHIYIKYHIKNNFRDDVLNDDIFENKQIIIIGPAPSSLDYGDNKIIDNFDYIVRINTSYELINIHKDLLGTRTDILFHNMIEKKDGGGGYLDFKKLNKQSIKYIVYPYNSKRRMINYYKTSVKYDLKNIFRLAPKYFNELNEAMDAEIPTTGLQALNYILKQNFDSLHITGFTFFKTGYAKGYRDKYQSAENAISLSKRSNNHDPDEELEKFIDIYNKAKSEGKNIYLDDELSKIIKNQSIKVIDE